MTYDLPCVSQLALYIFSMHVIGGNSQTHWKLDVQDGKIVEVDGGETTENDKEHESKDNQDIINIIWYKPLDFRYDSWILKSPTTDYLENDDDVNTENDISDLKLKQVETINIKPKNNKVQNHIQPTAHVVDNRLKTQDPRQTLSCGDPVNETKYDHLRGIADRHIHPNVPEPDVAMTFQAGGTSDVDMTQLERKLRKLKKTKPNSISTYSKIGNFWRIKGDTQMSIECFRKVLSIAPNNPEVLLNLARVLFNLRYLDDAISLTRRSLELQNTNMNSWLQHYTLGEILKAYGHFHEASVHFHHALSLNPGFQPACGHLRDLNGPPPTSVTQYAMFIGVVVVVVVAIGMLSSGDVFEDGKEGTTRTPRHFNRAMAMRSLKNGSKMPRLRRISSAN